MDLLSLQVRLGVLLSCLWQMCGGVAIGQEPVAELIFPLHPQHNHAPGIAELQNGELIASWYRGSGERTADDVAVWGARLKPGSTAWSESFLLADTPGFPDCNTADDGCGGPVISVLAGDYSEHVGDLSDATAGLGSPGRNGGTRVES